jgi:hypothetical protein
MINLTELSIKEVETILRHLGAGQYVEVSDLITKIRDQAIPQVAKLQPDLIQSPVAEIQQPFPNSVAEKQQ